MHIYSTLSFTSRQNRYTKHTQTLTTTKSISKETYLNRAQGITYINSEAANNERQHSSHIDG